MIEKSSLQPSFIRENMPWTESIFTGSANEVHLRSPHRDHSELECKDEAGKTRYPNEWTQCCCVNEGGTAKITSSLL